MPHNTAVANPPTMNGMSVFTTCPASSGVPQDEYLRRVADVARWSEAWGCTGILVYADNSLVDPWIVAHTIIRHTRRLCPLVAVQPVFILGLVVVLIFDPLKTIVGLIAVHLVVFFVNALMCHGELARTRPAPRYLTGFYLWMATGGVVGGIGAGLIAPHVFDWVAEYFG